MSAAEAGHASLERHGCTQGSAVTTNAYHDQHNGPHDKFRGTQDALSATPQNRPWHLSTKKVSDAYHQHVTGARHGCLWRLPR
jgi:hypothetical protein